MKKVITILITISIILFLIVVSFAHSGRTDSNGGHHDYINGGYHYHHGYPAHQHTYGLCPYAYEDKEDYWRENNKKEKQNNAIKTVAIITSTATVLGTGVFIVYRKKQKSN